MAGLIAPDMCRFTYISTYSGRNVANVLDMFIDPQGGATRPVAIAAAAEALIDAWIDNVLANLSNNLETQSLSWVDLDSSSGSVGTATEGAVGSFPAPGLATGDAMPGNVSIRMLKGIVAARGQRQGRMYLCGGVESITTDGAPNTIQSANVATFNTAFDNFLDDLQISLTDVTGYPVVLHTHVDNTDPDDPVIVYDGFSAIQSLTCDPTLATQRRRLRR